jgi:hypothetical protein
MRAVGQAVRWEPKKGIGPQFIGTCFAYRRQGHFITAAHCVGDLQADQLGVITPRGGLIKSAFAVTRHPSADIAIIETPTMHVEGDEVEPFELIVSNWSLGEDFFAYGYPVDVLGPDPAKPTERLFKGHFQRFLDHKSQHLPFQYLAAELSFPSPAGLSGGPLFRPAAHTVLLGMATENLMSTTTLESVERLRRGDEPVERLSRERVIEYGVALMLSGVNDWIDIHIPPVTMSTP